jgi:phenylacetate-CoA ligase
MLETALAQLRFAASLIFGIPFAAWSLDALVAAATDTQREFGTLGDGSAELLGGPALDARTRRDMQLRRFRAQAQRGAQETRAYRQLFSDLGLDPARLQPQDIPQVPVTTKDTLREDPDAFVRRSARPVLRATTTGTTGRPTCISYSAAELHAIVALSTIGFLSTGDLSSEDVVQISTNSRGSLGNLSLAGACAHIGAQFTLAGVTEPAAALALLSEPRHLPGKKALTSVLSIYPSYLGELVETGLAAGYQPTDFGLERILTGGELVTAGLRERCQQLFGPVQVVEGYAMTETFPFGATRCGEGHLHFAPAHGLLEVHNPETDAAAQPGEAGSLVATPFAPFRETTILLRYDTEDMVQALEEPLTCNLSHLQGTSNVLGKRRLSVRHQDGWAFPRDVLEALEVLETVPLPARCGFWAVPGGVAVEVRVRSATPAVHRAVEHSLEDHGVSVRELRLVEDPRELRHPLPFRCDLKEASFGPSGAGATTSGQRPAGLACWRGG